MERQKNDGCYRKISGGSEIEAGPTLRRFRNRSEEKIGVNKLSAFGLFAVTAMVVCYAFENRSRRFVLGFAVSCVLGSIYGFLQGAWPFGLVEGIWSIVAFRRWWTARK